MSWVDDVRKGIDIFTQITGRTVDINSQLPSATGYTKYMLKNWSIPDADAISDLLKNDLTRTFKPVFGFFDGILGFFGGINNAAGEVNKLMRYSQILIGLLISIVVVWIAVKYLRGALK